jgi:16S rRNA processing protein RimM
MVEQVIVGTVGRPQGVRGEVTVRPRTDAVAQRFAAGATLRTADRDLEVAGHTLTQGRLVVAFAGVTDRDSAEALRGLDLWADAGTLQLDPDEFHDTDLIGLVAVDPDGNRLGEVIRVEHPPAQDLLVVRTPSGDRLVPFVSALVPEVDPAAGRVVIDPIPGLLSDGDADDED